MINSPGFGLFPLVLLISVEMCYLPELCCDLLKSHVRKSVPQRNKINDFYRDTALTLEIAMCLLTRLLDAVNKPAGNDGHNLTLKLIAVCRSI